MAVSSHERLLLEYMFPDGHHPAAVSERLQRWVQAFAHWLADLGARFTPGTTRQAKLSWKRLYVQLQLAHPSTPPMPWELESNDIAAHARWLAAQSYASSTIANSIGYLAGFYRWCAAQSIDPAAAPGFNPAAGVTRPRVRRYAGAAMWTHAEAAALLQVLQQDESPLGRRDYAFFLLRLQVGVPLASLRGLRWGMLLRPAADSQDPAAGGVSVRWPAGPAEPQPLSSELWDAVLSWLAASGRLADIQPQDFIFTPLKAPGQAAANDRAEHWVPHRALSSSQLLAELKLYGRLAGIAEQKLTLQALRRSAVRFALDSLSFFDNSSSFDELPPLDGQALQEMQQFMGSQEAPRLAKYRLSLLPDPADQPEFIPPAQPVALPQRTARPFQPGDGIKHGFFARAQPSSEVLQEILQVLDEGIEGIDEEIRGLRQLERRLVARQAEPCTTSELLQLVNAHTQAAARIGQLIAAEQQLLAPEKKWASQEMQSMYEWAEDLLDLADFMAVLDGNQPFGDSVRAELRGASQDLEDGARSVAEEQAGVRYSLRNVLAVAMVTDTVADLVRMADIYGAACVRLVRLLQRGSSGYEQRLTAYMRSVFLTALSEDVEPEQWETILAENDARYQARIDAHGGEEAYWAYFTALRDEIVGSWRKKRSRPSDIP